MLTIPLAQVPSQTVNIILNNQNCVINVYTKTTALFMDLMVNGVQIYTGAICLFDTIIYNYPFLNFIGYLAFVDTQGTNDPQYTGFNSRWYLCYFFPGELTIANDSSIL